MYWFDIREDCRSMFASLGFPIFIWIFGKGGEFGFYGFPSFDSKTIKIATEQFTAVSDRITCSGRLAGKKSKPCTKTMPKAACREFPIDAAPRSV